MILYHPSHLDQGLRRENDAEAIANLKRKGWLETVKPAHNPATQHAPEWAIATGQWIVRNKTAEELAADVRKTWTSYQFLKRFTAQERKAVRIKAKSDDLVDDFLMLCSAAQQVVSDDSDTVAGMGYLVTVGVITEARKVEILTAP